jgi:hypothetical protein
LFLFVNLFVQVIYSDEEKKFNIEIIFGLIHSKLLNLGEYNVHLTKLIDGGRNSTLRFKILRFIFYFLYLCTFINKKLHDGLKVLCTCSVATCLPGLYILVNCCDKPIEINESCF